MGFSQRLGKKLKAAGAMAGRGALSLGKKVATAALYGGIAVLGAKAAWDHYGDDITDAAKRRIQEDLIDPAKAELTAQGEALSTNIQNIAQEGQAGIVSGVQAAINPLSSQSAGDAFQQGGGEAAQHQAELVGALGNKPAAQAVQDRYDQANALPDENAPTGQAGAGAIQSFESIEAAEARAQAAATPAIGAPRRFRNPLRRRG
tara:strand:- start:927 stop:1538 length:612 start_codon:yes stop_codon:yes gene_type:complete